MYGKQITMILCKYRYDLELRMRFVILSSTSHTAITENITDGYYCIF